MFAAFAAHGRSECLQSRQGSRWFLLPEAALGMAVWTLTLRFGAYYGSLDRSDCAATIFAFRMSAAWGWT